MASTQRVILNGVESDLILWKYPGVGGKCNVCNLHLND